MQAALEPFLTAHTNEDAWAVASLLSPIAPPSDPGRLYDFYRASNEHMIENDIRTALIYSRASRLEPSEGSAWSEIFVNYWKVVGQILRAEEATNQGRSRDRQWVDVFDAWKTLTNSLLKHLERGNIRSWTMICMYHAAKDLRKFAIKADEQLATAKGNVTFNSGFQDDVVTSIPRNEMLEEAARVLNRMFRMCLSDRNPDMRESRKWGTYFMASLLFKTYFKLKAISLSQSVVRSIEAMSDLPSFELYPKAHRVTYKYYVGVLAFLQEDYTKAEAYLTEAWEICYVGAKKNQQLILTYLIPCRLITKHAIPTPALLSPFPLLQSIFAPLVSCIKRGDLSGFDAALVAGENQFVKRRIYLTLERGRDIAQRNLLRKVFLAGGYEELKEGQTEADRIRKTRIPLANFGAALRMGMGMDGDGSGQALEDDEVECIVANMIYKVSAQRGAYKLSPFATLTHPPQSSQMSSVAVCLAQLRLP
ncbi:hypothetical protein CC78DRAFT_475207 [Lojkania enalia]|uniref:PCI domain-containing protein n=1 Tax=Lojkania enalia TaxID=147567 RepID=A0A9P4JYK2_9PLEO|nr:hypothetical protein CC78DRAFT_475207 [Didymosphaeria enalia]